MRILILLFWLHFLPFSFANNVDKQEFVLYEIRQKNWLGNLYLPKIASEMPVVIVLGGSSGGMRTEYGELLAKHGFAALTLAYFRADGLPNTLDNIPVESVIDAVDYLSSVKSLEASNIGIWGASRGSELAFLAASNDPRIQSLVATTPSSVAWHGRVTANAWTIKGQAVNSLTFARRSSSSIFERASQALKEHEKVQLAQFEFEKINGPILLISAKNDHIWPSYQMANDIQSYLKKLQFKYVVRHDTYPTGHFFNDATRPIVHASIIDHFKLTLGN